VSTLRRAILASLVAVVVVAGTAMAGSVNGTWKGRLLDPQLTGRDVPPPERAPIKDFPISTLRVGSASAELSSSGVTMATHDPPTAVSSCTMRFRYAAAQGGWRLYRQVGRMQLGGAVSGGAPALSPCYTRGAAVRFRPAGAKLKIEAVGYYRPDEGAGNFEGWPMRGYLSR